MSQRAFSGLGHEKFFFCRLKQTKPSYELFERTHFAMALSQVISSAGWGSAAKSKTKVVYNCRDRDQKKLRDSISCLMSPPPPVPPLRPPKKGKWKRKISLPPSSFLVRGHRGAEECSIPPYFLGQSVVGLSFTLRERRRRRVPFCLSPLTVPFPPSPLNPIIERER